MTLSQIDVPATLTALTPLVGAVGIILMGFWGRKVRAEVKEVKVIVNGQKTHMLQTNAGTTRRLARITEDPMDVADATEAERLYQERLAEEAAQRDANAKLEAKHETKE